MDPAEMDIELIRTSALGKEISAVNYCRTQPIQKFTEESWAYLAICRANIGLVLALLILCVRDDRLPALKCLG